MTDFTAPSVGSCNCGGTQHLDEIQSYLVAQGPHVAQFFRGIFFRDQMAANRQAHRDAMVPGEFDEATVRAQAEAQAELMVEMRVATARAKSRVFTVLTEEQQRQLQELREQRQACRGGRGFGKGLGW